MQTAYRIFSRNSTHDPLSGEGASQFPGRWNLEGTKVIYAAESLSLAILETIVNLKNASSIPSFKYIELSFQKKDIYNVMLDQKQSDWLNPVQNLDSRQFGTDILQNNSNKVIQVPSSVVPESYNYLIPPLLIKNNKVSPKEPKEYALDLRLFH
ncbi:MAG: RES domain-containing protein [Candidatus Margulisbacteria bacterium]|nr:RES domain-containing protein [Candidatus Margulisiibacteriota bacterium]